VTNKEQHEEYMEGWRDGAYGKPMADTNDKPDSHYSMGYMEGITAARSASFFAARRMNVKQKPEITTP